MDLDIREIRPDDVEDVSKFWSDRGERDAADMTPQRVASHIRRHSGRSLGAWVNGDKLVAVVLVLPVAGGHRMRLVADPTALDAATRQLVLNKATMKLAARGVQRCQISVSQAEDSDDLLPQLRWNIDEDFTPASARFNATAGELLDDSPLATEASLPPAAEEPATEPVETQTPELVRV